MPPSPHSPPWSQLGGSLALLAIPQPLEHLTLSTLLLTMYVCLLSSSQDWKVLGGGDCFIHLHIWLHHTWVTCVLESCLAPGCPKCLAMPYCMLTLLKTTCTACIWVGVLVTFLGPSLLSHKSGILPWPIELFHRQQQGYCIWSYK